MKVVFLTMPEFLEACAYFVQKGMGFKAYAGDLTIEFTGAY